MTKEQALRLIKLLSAIESWSLSNGGRMPDYLHEAIEESVDLLSKILLRENN